MCGLFGAIRPSATPLGLLTDRFGQLGRLAESRGRDAAGWASLAPDGRRCGPSPTAISRAQARAGRWSVLKYPGPFGDLWEQRSDLDQDRLNRALTIMGHTRAASQGRIGVLANCSPMLTGRVLGTHNGDVDASALPTEGTAGGTDTEVLLAALSAAGGNPSAAITALRAAPGRAALVWARYDQPRVVNLARGAYSPLYLSVDGDGVLWWASNPEWLRTALGRARKVVMIQEGTVLEACAEPELVRVELVGRFPALARSRDRLAERFVYAGFSPADRIADQARLSHETTGPDLYPHRLAR